MLRTDLPCQDLPNKFGPWQTYYGCFERWNDNSTLDELLQRLRATQVDIGEVNEDL